ncbi:DNA alkylation repair protein [Mangrovivirga sp. M17]|uniref:DNA alkylation repair protein n=1 Tax=Mangrovivirga halotolerans TaxID=2993936 RepID=A0ABT3RLF7_9BACT|nr:DNA alkylation repair protein [Mangrovivirga halotolerans]MCX2742395.1 DNA alkylation repair protein [Mangrovivirga halotolerans]
MGTDERYQEIIEELKQAGSESDRISKQKFGISSQKALGVRNPEIRRIAKSIKPKNNKLAQNLWDSEYLEARILASIIANPKTISKNTIQEWANDIDNWAVCDHLCMDLLDKTIFYDDLISEWVDSKQTYKRRASFATIAASAVHNKHLKNIEFEKYFDLIKNGSINEKEKIVLKAIDWAGRQIGKRNSHLNMKMTELAEEMIKINKGKSKLVGNIIYKEITSDKVQKRIKKIK